VPDGQRKEELMTTLPVDPVILSALRQAQAALSRYLEPGGPGEADTINALLGLLDSRWSVPNEQSARSRSQPLPGSTRRAFSCSAQSKAAGMSDSGGAWIGPGGWL
jgi:hypothetical protein